jgi:hypothetical protein
MKVVVETLEIEMSHQAAEEEENSVSIPEIEMTSDTDPIQVQSDDLQEIEEADIRNITHFETRNRKFHHINPYNLVEKGNYIAGAFIANVPDNNKYKQINYLVNLLKLPKEKLHLIQTTFSNGNG